MDTNRQNYAVIGKLIDFPKALTLIVKYSPKKSKVTATTFLDAILFKQSHIYIK